MKIGLIWKLDAREIFFLNFDLFDDFLFNLNPNFQFFQLLNQFFSVN